MKITVSLTYWDGHSLCQNLAALYQILNFFSYRQLQDARRDSTIRGASGFALFRAGLPLRRHCSSLIVFHRNLLMDNLRGNAIASRYRYRVLNPLTKLAVTRSRSKEHLFLFLGS